MRILLLEDDQIFGETLEIFLERENYEVTWITTVEEAEEITFAQKFDLYLFDINLPDGRGLELLEGLRHAEDETAVIFITALTDLHAMEKGFKLGATDYIKKPFDPQELLIRIEAKFNEKSIKYRNVAYHHDSRTITVDKKIVNLGTVPTKIFAKLINRIGELVSKEELYRCLEEPSDNALRFNIAKIKQKLSVDIKNVRGRGYMLEDL